MATLLQAVSLSLALAVLALVGAPTTSAQVVFDDFNDGNVDNAGAFAGGAEMTGAGTGPTDGFGGDPDTGLNLGVDPGSGGGFAGAFVTAPGGIADVSGQTYFRARVRPSLMASNLPFVLEITLQEDPGGDGFDPAVDDELRTFYSLNLDASWQFVEIPLATFQDSGAGLNDGFDFSNLLNVVFVAGGLTGDPFAISFDEIVFDVTNTILGGGIFFDDFNDGNVDNTGAFAGGADNTGAGTGPTDGSSGDPDTGLNLGVDPGTGGGFAGAFITFPGGTFDATGAGYFFASVRPSLQASNLPFVLEITLQEDPGGDGFDPAVDDELRTFYSLDLNADWREVQIPLATFQDSPAGLNDGFDFSSILNVVFVAGGLTGDPFAISFDDILFTSSTPVSNEEFVPGTVDGFALSAAYPNPFQTSARVELSLDRAEAVRVEVYDVLGRQVALLHDGTLAAQTPHSFTLNARGLASGLYLYRVTGESFSATRRVILN